MEPGSPEWHARRRHLLDQESMEPHRWWWLSFADAEHGFLGVTIVRAQGIITATDRARDMGANPGGEVQAFPLPPEAGKTVEPHVNKLLSKAELEEAGLI